MDKIEYKKDYPWPEHSHKAFAKHSDNELITLMKQPLSNATICNIRIKDFEWRQAARLSID